MPGLWNERIQDVALPGDAVEQVRVPALQRWLGRCQTTRGRYAEAEATLLESYDGLRAVRDSMDPEQYDAAMEELLVEMALKTREIRARAGGGS